MMPEGLPDLGDMMKEISANPAAREMLMSLLAPSDKEEPQTDGASPSDHTDDAIEASNTDAFTPPRRHGGVGRHRALLCALRPYLGEKRCATLSRMERALELYEVIEQMKHTKGGI